MNGCEDVGPWAGRPRAEMMKSDEVEAMLHLHALGWGLKRIAREFGCSKNTVRRYVAADGWMAYSRPVRGGKLEALRARQHPDHVEPFCRANGARCSVTWWSPRRYSTGCCTTVTC